MYINFDLEDYGFKLKTFKDYSDTMPTKVGFF